MIVLDTCIIIWDALEPERLSKNAVKAINKAIQHNNIIISDISILEISMLIKKKRIEIESIPSIFIHLFLKTRNVTVKSITPEIAEWSVNIGTSISGDPADRIIAATSIINHAQLITADRKLLECNLIDTIW